LVVKHESFGGWWLRAVLLLFELRAIAEEANFFIAGLLYLSCLVTVGNLGAYSIASENRSSVALRSAVHTWTSVGSEMAC
jgi:hypothetical protein